MWQSWVENVHYSRSQLLRKTRLYLYLATFRYELRSFSRPLLRPSKIASNGLDTRRVARKRTKDYPSLGHSVGNFLGWHRRFKSFRVLVLLIVLKIQLFAQLAHRRSTNILLRTGITRLNLCMTMFADAAKFKWLASVSRSITRCASRQRLKTTQTMARCVLASVKLDFHRRNNP